MKKLSNTETELKKALLIKKSCSLITQGATKIAHKNRISSYVRYI